MKTNLQRRFGIVRDVREVECPFGPGIFFGIRRVGHPAVVAQAEKLQAEAPLVQKFYAELAKAKTKQVLLGKSGKVDVEAIAEKVFGGEVADQKSLAELLRSNCERIATFIDSWRGLENEAGEPLELTLDNAVALLQAPELLGENEPYASQELELEDGNKRVIRRTLGGALQAWLEEEANRQQDYVEAAAKNSQASSAGVPVSSAG